LQGQYYKLSKKFQEFIILASLEAPTGPHAQVCIEDHLFSSKFDFFGLLIFGCVHVKVAFRMVFFFHFLGIVFA